MPEITLEQRRKMADEGYDNCRVTRLDAADDLVFTWVTQWDDGLLNNSNLSYKGEFNIIAKAIRQVLADLRANPVQISFHPLENSSEDDADLVDGMYRTNDLKNSSQESYFNASQEAVSCGVGGWELYTEYETSRSKQQVICREPIHEYNNVVFWDPQSKLMDKSDAGWVVRLTRYTREGYFKLYENLTGEKHAGDGVAHNPSNFKFPQYSYAFPWMGGNYDWIFIATTYYRESIEDTVLTFMDPITQETSDYYDSEVKDRMDELVSQGLVIVNKKHIDRYVVTKFIDSGEANLYEGEIACEHIPIVPLYGERVFVEGQEVWRGLTKLAKDPQRLQNFLMSYIADIASRSPRAKPFFFAEQIAGHQDMYNDNGADNNLPYYLLNRVTQNGIELPAGSAGIMPEQTIPQSVGTLVQLASQSVRDTLPDAMNADYANIELSGDAIAQLNGRVNQQSVVFQQNMKHSKRRDAEIWLSFAGRIYDTTKEVVLTKADGGRVKKTLMKMEMDRDSGEPVMKYNLKLAKFDVSTEVGPSFQSQREQGRQELAQQIIALPPDDPMRKVYQYIYATMLDGSYMAPARKFANKQMILENIKEPETPEEQKWAEEAAQSAQQPDPQEQLVQIEAQKAQADTLHAQAAMLRAQVQAKKIDADIHFHDLKARAGVFNVETGRINAHTKQAQVMIDAHLKSKDQDIKKQEGPKPSHSGGEVPKPKKQSIGELHNAPRSKHPVHGAFSEKDIHDTMRAHNMTRPQVMAKLHHHHEIYSAMGAA